MSLVKDLIAKACPNGVNVRSLKEVGTMFGGLTGKSKSDFTDGNARFVSYTNVYTNPAVNLVANDFVRVGSAERQHTLRRGDILFTGSSETADEVGISSVVTTEVGEPLYLNSFCIGYRLNDPNILYPDFAKHLFRSKDIRKQVIRTASGVTRFNVSKDRLSRVKIPIPPIEVQREIARVLDLFHTLETELETELKCELGARRRQYDFYRDQLLTSHPSEVRWATLGDISVRVSSGGTPLVRRSDYYDGGTIPWLRTQEVRFGEIWATDMRITEKAVKETSANWIPENCVIVAISGATAGRSAINKIPLSTNQHCCNFQIDPQQANYRYVFHWVRSRYEAIKAMGHGARSDLNAGLIKSFQIPVPPLDEQDRLVTILDQLDALVNELLSSLPDERSARRKQYEFYRDRLLTFEELTV